MKLSLKILVLIFASLVAGTGITYAQQTADSLLQKSKSTVKSTIIDTAKKFNPHIATIRSAILPGWGQIYNKKYWKLGLIYPALGITTYVFIQNLNTYKQLRQAFKYKSDTIPGNDVLIPANLQGLSAESLRSYRNEFRQNIDYTVLVFILFWGLNVVDATVDAHLKGFDVSDDISMKLKPHFDPLSYQSGLSLVFSFKDKSTKHILSLP